LARLAFARIAVVVGGRGSRRVLGTLATLLIALFTGRQLMEEFPATPAFADPVTRAYARQARVVAALAGGGVLAPALGPSPNLDSGLERLDGADVLLIFVESYGAVAFEAPGVSAGLAAGRSQIAAAIRDTGRDVVSAYVESPTFGGSSWLAHLSLLSGVEVRDQDAYLSLMTSSRRTLVTSFAQRGYRTVALMPGMRQEWPEGAFYAFDAIYGSDRLEYDGPQFGWWTIPDQYALARLDVLERARRSRPPLFVVFPTSTTHAPFGPVPPYQADWSRVLTSDAFDPDEVARAMAATPDYTDLRPSYVRAMAYEYTAFTGYLREHADDDMIVILLGDHQPPAAVAGREASWSVPIHVIARSEHVLQRLDARGFRPGIEPRRPSIGPMHTLVPMLLDAFSHDAHEGANPLGHPSGGPGRAQP
jgi:hypothetical protein